MVAEKRLIVFKEMTQYFASFTTKKQNISYNENFVSPLEQEMNICPSLYFLYGMFQVLQSEQRCLRGEEVDIFLVLPLSASHGCT